MIGWTPNRLAKLSNRKRSTARRLDCRNGLSWRSAFIDWLLKEEADLQATAALHFFGSAAMSTPFWPRKQLRRLPPPNPELPFRPQFFKCVKVGSKLGCWIPVLDADW